MRACRVLKDLHEVQQFNQLSPLYTSLVLSDKSVYFLLSTITDLLFFLHIFTPYFILYSWHDKLNKGYSTVPRSPELEPHHQM